MRRIHPIPALVLIFFGALLLCGQEVIEEIIAIVNDDVITFSQYKAEEEGLYQMLKAQYSGEELEKQYALYRRTLLDRMITELLLLQEAKKSNFNVNEQLKMWIENLKKDNNIDSDEELVRTMRQQGLDFEEIKRQMTDNLLRQNVLYAEVQSKIVVEDSEIVNYYKLHPEEFTEPVEYKLRAIYVSAEGKGEEEVEAKKQEISQKIASGEDFAALAGQYSEGPEKESQGDLGHIKKGHLEKTLEQAVENLKQGETTSWLKVQRGWYILKLEEKKESWLKPFEEARKGIEEKFLKERSQGKIEEYIKELRERSYIKILKPNPWEH